MLIVLTDISFRFFPDCTLIASIGGKSMRIFSCFMALGSETPAGRLSEMGFLKRRRTDCGPATHGGRTLWELFFEHLHPGMCMFFVFFRSILLEGAPTRTRGEDEELKLSSNLLESLTNTK